jgi:hypothetical protein
MKNLRWRVEQGYAKSRTDTWLPFGLFETVWQKIKDLALAIEPFFGLFRMLKKMCILKHVLDNSKQNLQYFTKI